MKYSVKRGIGLLAAVVLLMSLLPLSAFAGLAQEVTVSTWEELRDALQSPGYLQIKVTSDTVIEYTFDSETEDYRDVQITVNGRKLLLVYGAIQFHNALGNGAGLINLNSDTTELEVSGSSIGSIQYSLQGGENPEIGDLFYMTAGSLTLGGALDYVVDYTYHDNRIKMHQAVIGGTGGSAWVKGAYLRGNTIFAEGIDFTFTNGALKGITNGTTLSYKNADLFLEKGSAVFEGCVFYRGITMADRCDTERTLKDDTVVCINLNESGYTAARNYIIYNAPCAFRKHAFGNLSPAMPEGSTLCNLGTFGLGDAMPAIKAELYYQYGALGTRLMDVVAMEVYRDEELIYEAETDSFGEREMSYDLSTLGVGEYMVFIELNMVYGNTKVRSTTYGYTFSVVEEIAHVEVTLDKADMKSLEAVESFADVSTVTWYEKSKTGDSWTANPSTLRDGYTYAVEFSVVSVGGKYPFKNGYTVAVDGTPVTKQANGKWRYEYVKTGYLTRIEMYDICLPAPGHHPDFIAHKGNPPYSSYEVTWAPYVDGKLGEPLTAEDVFEENTWYCLEVRLIADTGFEFDYAANDEAYAYINNKKASVYYPKKGDESCIAAYVYYNTSHCISEVQVSDVQYPIPGKTPDTDAYVFGTEKSKYKPVSYADGSTVEWYYETNPGTSAAGFAKLDGKFKADRRHQAYVTLETEDGYWFATDNKGNLSVAVYFEGEPMAFAYTTDSYTDDGACNRIETARTFERAQDVDGVFVDGMWLYDGLYMSTTQWGVRTEETVDTSEGYACYKDGVLTLHDFNWVAQGDYNIIDSYRQLTIRLEGYSLLGGNKNGIVVNDTLTLEGNGRLLMASEGEGIFAMGAVTVNSGEWCIEDYVYDGMWLYDSLTVNGGLLNVYGRNCGIYGDDYPPVTINGGTVVACSDNGYAIWSCDTRIADGAEVLVATDTFGEGAAPWDGVTDFIDYSYVKIVASDDVLLGDVNEDGVVDMRDSFAVYRVASGVAGFTSEETAIADMNDDGVIDMRDAFAVYRIASGAA